MGRCKENADRGGGGEDAEDDQTEPVDHLRGFCIATFFASSSKNIELAIPPNLVIFISPPKKYSVFFYYLHSEKVLRMKI